MKKLKNTVSPFIMLLVPVFLLVGISVLSIDKEVPSGLQEVSIKFRAPEFKDLVRAVID